MVTFWLLGFWWPLRTIFQAWWSHRCPNPRVYCSPKPRWLKLGGLTWKKLAWKLVAGSKDFGLESYQEIELQDSAIQIWNVDFSIPEAYWGVGFLLWGWVELLHFLSFGLDHVDPELSANNQISNPRKFNEFQTANVPYVVDLLLVVLVQLVAAAFVILLGKFLLPKMLGFKLALFLPAENIDDLLLLLEVDLSNCKVIWAHCEIFVEVLIFVVSVATCLFHLFLFFAILQKKTNDRKMSRNDAVDLESLKQGSDNSDGNPLISNKEVRALFCV